MVCAYKKKKTHTFMNCVMQSHQTHHNLLRIMVQKKVRGKSVVQLRCFVNDSGSESNEPDQPIFLKKW